MFSRYDELKRLHDETQRTLGDYRKELWREQLKICKESHGFYEGCLAKDNDGNVVKVRRIVLDRINKSFNFCVATSKGIEVLSKDKLEFVE